MSQLNSDSKLESQSQPYQVLARKYRPSNFHELIGQTHVSQALINAIDHNRLHHAYLFTGTRGVGKTTIARILAKCLNCDTGITSTPCGSCDSCQAIEQGRFIDLIEIDAASRTKVEDTRELLDNVPYAPTQGRYKVYLIDEVHMLSTHSFNALLKTLEEPPEHVKFLLATTDPQKLPITIISRCLQFVLRPLPQQLLTEHLSKLLNNEGIGYEDAALWQLAHAAKGSVRDSLSLTDQAIAFGQGKLSENTVNEMLGLINGADLSQLLADIYSDNRQAVANQIEQMRQQMVDAGSVFDELADLVHKVAMVQIMPNISLNVNETQASAINQLAQQISSDVLQLYYEIIVKSRESIMLATTPMQALEMCLLRLLAFRPLAVNQVQNSSVDAQPIANVETMVVAGVKTEKLTEVEQADDEQAETIEANEAKQVTMGQAGFHAEGVTDTKVAESATSDESAQRVINQVPAEDTSGIYTDSPVQVNPDLHIETDTSLDTDIEVQLEEQTAIETQTTIETDLNADLAIESVTPSVPSDSSSNPAQVYAVEPSNADFDEGENEDEIEDDDEYEDDFMLGMLDDRPTDTQEELANNTPLLKPEKAEDLVRVEDVVSERQIESAKIESTHDDVIQSRVAVTHDGDPRELLKCAPQELVGHWTAEKWDYWLQTARETNLLDEEELAFARQGVMTGECNGASEFVTASDNSKFKGLFEKLTDKLQQTFNQASYQIVISDQANGMMVAEQIPHTLTENRRALAENTARHMLSQSPVIQLLSQQDSPQIDNLKLNL